MEIRLPSPDDVANHFALGGEHVIIFHLLTEGRATVRLDNGDRVALNAGDIVMIPHGDRHILENGPATPTVDESHELARIFAQGLKLWQTGGGGEVTRFVCGYMACDPRLSNIFLGGLPALFKVEIRKDASGSWLENSVRFLVDGANRLGAGGEAVLARLSEALFVQTLRTYIAQLPSSQTGWLAGVRDEGVGRL